jgi:hypothetical protein
MGLGIHGIWDSLDLGFMGFEIHGIWDSEALQDADGLMIPAGSVNATMM